MQCHLFSSFLFVSFEHLIFSRIRRILMDFTAQHIDIVYDTCVHIQMAEAINVAKMNIYLYLDDEVNEVKSASAHTRDKMHWYMLFMEIMSSS